jgi:hypothetical protein
VDDVGLVGVGWNRLEYVMTYWSGGTGWDFNLDTCGVGGRVCQEGKGWKQSYPSYLPYIAYIVPVQNILANMVLAQCSTGLN